MKRIVSFCIETFLIFIMYIIGFIPYILLFSGLYLIKHLTYPKLPFSIFIIIFFILTIIYDS